MYGAVRPEVLLEVNIVPSVSVTRKYILFSPSLASISHESPFGVTSIQSIELSNVSSFGSLKLYSRDSIPSSSEMRPSITFVFFCQIVVPVLPISLSDFGEVIFICGRSVFWSTTRSSTGEYPVFCAESVTAAIT